MTDINLQGNTYIKNSRGGVKDINLQGNTTVYCCTYTIQIVDLPHDRSCEKIWNIYHFLFQVDRVHEPTPTLIVWLTIQVLYWILVVRSCFNNHYSHRKLFQILNFIIWYTHFGKDSSYQKQFLDIIYDRICNPNS